MSCDDRFLPEPEVDEYHQVRVRAPAAVTFAAAKQMDIQASPIVKGIFWLRAIPALLRGEPFRPQGSQGIVAETLGQGWGVLAEVPDREIVIGAYTQPWHEHVEFRPLPPEEFAAFREPGYVKIVWTLAAEPAGPGESLFVTRTRVAATDPQSRTKFRRYWAPISAGIILIRYAGLPLVKKEAERQASQLAGPPPGPAGPRSAAPGPAPASRRHRVIIQNAVEIRQSAEDVFDYSRWRVTTMATAPAAASPAAGTSVRGRCRRRQRHALAHRCGPPTGWSPRYPSSSRWRMRKRSLWQAASFSGRAMSYCTRPAPNRGARR